MYDLPFTLADVLELCGIHEVKHERRTECPFCHQKAMFYNLNRNTYHCFKCDSAGGALAFYREMFELTSNSQARKDIMRSLYGETDDAQREERQRKIEARKKEIKESVIKESPLREITMRDAAYSSLLSMLPLAEDHVMELRRRGLSSAVIKENQYRTVPQDFTGELCIRLLEQGFYLDGVPGFYKKDGTWRIRSMKRGIMIPIRDREGLIQGFQIRKDINLLKDGEGKYTWFSSKDLPDGTGAPGAIHFACDFKNGRPVLTDGSIYLTEGPLKGDIAHMITGKPFICVPGVNCQNMLGQALSYLAENCGLKMVYNCYDMDYQTNENVMKAMAASYSVIEDLGLTAVRLVWNEEYKGIDDYLVSKI